MIVQPCSLVDCESGDSLGRLAGRRSAQPGAEKGAGNQLTLHQCLTAPGYFVRVHFWY